MPDGGGEAQPELLERCDKALAWAFRHARADMLTVINRCPPPKARPLPRGADVWEYATWIGRAQDHADRRLRLAVNLWASLFATLELEAYLTCVASVDFARGGIVFRDGSIQRALRAKVMRLLPEDLGGPRFVEGPHTTFSREHPARWETNPNATWEGSRAQQALAALRPSEDYARRGSADRERGPQQWMRER